MCFSVSNVYFQISVELLPLASVPYPSPLEEGMPKEIYDKYIAPPPLSEATESKKDLLNEVSLMFFLNQPNVMWTEIS